MKCEGMTDMERLTVRESFYLTVCKEYRTPIQHLAEELGLTPLEMYETLDMLIRPSLEAYRLNAKEDAREKRKARWRAVKNRILSFFIRDM